ncbi:MAG TPA: hypothetical protein DCM08_12660 [Microscillaceae bacterium]|nr:hypothetical protein [Microscillaceae bacterium]
MGLGEVGELEAQMLNKPQMFIEVQMFNLALLPPFCQTLVSCSPFFCLFILSLIFVAWCVGLVALLLFLALVCVVEKKQMCYQMLWALSYCPPNKCKSPLNCQKAFTFLKCL